MIVNTFIAAIPEMANVAGLLFLGLYIYAILGVFLFAETKLSNANYHANFRNFGYALLTLFRMSTGENWNDIMADAARTRSIEFDCSTH